MNFLTKNPSFFGGGGGGGEFFYKLTRNPNLTIFFFFSFFFMPPKELRWHIKIEPSVRQSVRPLQIVSQRYLINY